jgi:hypothetical protein
MFGDKLMLLNIPIAVGVTDPTTFGTVSSVEGQAKEVVTIWPFAEISVVPSCSQGSENQDSRREFRDLG